MRSTSARLLAPLCLLFASLSPQGKVFMTTKQALARAFVGCKVERKSYTLSSAQRAAIEEKAGSKLRSSIVRAYIARDKKGAVVGTAYFEAHPVRTMREVLMVAVSNAHTIQRVDLLSFGEPLSYIPGKPWYGQFVGRPLDERLRLRRGIDGVSGATLTARATTRCARRMLAVHAVLFPRKKKR